MMCNTLTPSVAFSAVLFLTILSGSTGEPGPQATNSLTDDTQVMSNQAPQPVVLTEGANNPRAWKQMVSTFQHLQKVLADHLREKRAWTDLHHSGWGKRNWGDLKSAWGKRGWQDLQGAWGKRSSGNGWTKRDWNKFHGSWGKRDAYYPDDIYDDDFDQIDSVYDDEEAEDTAQDEAGNASRWGKRDWSSFKGSWGKRDPAWHNLKGLWGKRADGTNWNKLTGVWG